MHFENLACSCYPVVGKQHTGGGVVGSGGGSSAGAVDVGVVVVRLVLFG